MRHDQFDWRMWFLGAPGLGVLASTFISRLLGRSADPDEVEKQRRVYLNQVGRIVEGQITDFVELPESALEEKKGRPTNNGPRKLVYYSYSISGVSYETAQDITTLDGHAGMDRIIAGLSASVKYDPSNPSNSILIADDWSGLR